MRQYIPFALPYSVNVPFVGRISGDGVVYLLFVGIVLILLLLFIVIALVRGSRARAGMVDRVLKESMAARSGITTGSASTIETTLDPARGRGLEFIATAAPYGFTMDQIGGHLGALDAQHVCVGEVEGGYLLLYTGKEGDTIVETLTPEQIAAFPQPHGTPRPLHQRLIQIGRFLDQQTAISVLVTQQQGGYYVEYATPPTGAHAASKVVRVSRLMNDETLARLAAVQ